MIACACNANTTLKREAASIMNRYKFTFFTMILFCMIGCSGSNDIPDSTTSLTSSEQSALARELINTAAELAFGLDPTATFASQGLWSAQAIQKFVPGKGSSPKNGITEDVDESSFCGVDGNLEISGTIEYDEEDVSNDEELVDVGFDLDIMHEECQTELIETNNKLTYFGSVHAQGSYQVNTQEPSYTFTFEINGGVDVQDNENGNGTCGIDITVTAEINNEASFTASGEICGESYSEEYSS